ncbi:KTSC domain-containing protein [Superficieibacter sp. HKU1]|uniref:KTSC domain-containing protein n=1 Tax=Superficieibacter sp. HKU1 TaxID=3031919 RepID=UPI0023E13FD5|nr:KTSC domain-containing protein [Superficieibacter sp. HKU1]WES70400.1 KTSC domain-containing protein [Superficieibacter sp. HKU1]
MNRQTVSSSNIHSIGYDPVSHTLEIVFLSGGIYQCRGLPVTVYQALMTAAFKGSYFYVSHSQCLSNREDWLIIRRGNPPLFNIANIYHALESCVAQLQATIG